MSTVVKPREILVLGMHRSGTSALSGFLTHIGIYAGDSNEMTAPAPENPKGFFERKDIRSITDFVLHSVGMDWDKLVNWNIIKIPDNIRNIAINKFGEIIAGFPQNKSWLIKEPRLSLMYGIFLPILKNPLCIIMYRNPLEVALSLSKRNAIPLRVGAALWELYTLSALNQTNSSERLLIEYGNLMVNTKEIATRLGNILNVKRAEAGINDKALNFIDKSLYRSKFIDEALPLIGDRPKQIYKDLLEGDFSKYEKCRLSEESYCILSEYEKQYVWQGNIRRIKDEKVMVCIPSFNDEDSIIPVLKNIQDQSYENIDVLIVDDNSTDATYHLAHEFCRTDKRFRCIKNARNIGLVLNFNKCFSQRAGEYFMLKSSNDLINNNYITKCIERHRENQRAALVYTRCCFINKNNKIIKLAPERSYFETSVNNRVASVLTVVSRYEHATPFWGIYKTRFLDFVFPYRFIRGGDHLFVCEMSLQGDIQFVDDVLYYRKASDRDENRTAYLQTEDIFYNIRPEDVQASCYCLAPNWSLVIEHGNMLSMTDLHNKEREYLIPAVYKILLQRFNSQLAYEKMYVEKLLKDIDRNVDYNKCVVPCRKPKLLYLKNQIDAIISQVCSA